MAFLYVKLVEEFGKRVIVQAYVPIRVADNLKPDPRIVQVGMHKRTPPENR